ncbi:arsenate reductase [Priestia taiwanensis]|nr:arsenate reductase [Priestia taiwanensis]
MNKMLRFYTYPKCGTCQKAKKWFEEKGVAYEAIHIVEQTPSKETLKELLENSGLELKKFFNTSGVRYRELNVKEKVATASEEELLALLASDGMLIKRPIVTDGKKVTLGFNEDVFEKEWL